MPRSKSASSTIWPTLASLSPAQIRAAIPLLEYRKAELEALSVATISSGTDPKIVSLANAIDATLARIYGPGTYDYNRLSEAKELDDTVSDNSVQVAYMGGYGTSIQEVREGIERGRQKAIALLTQEIALLKEQLGDDEGISADRAIRAYMNLDLHSEIAWAASELYQDGHYANAIEDAVKALNGLVRFRSGETLDGVGLMQKVFSPNAPILRFNAMADPSDKDEQVGFMMMFSGAVAGLRNPRAHKLIKDDPERALEFIAFVSLLAKLLDGAVKV
jgi:uncharacterized protein (TIGR02391 family)